MNAIAQQLGEVGLPAPVAELAARRWDAIVVGGGHNGLTAAAYLAKAGKSVLVLERRERLGGACTLERPFADPEYVVSPCAYVVGLLDELVINELTCKARGLHVRHRRPQPVGPVRRRHELRPVARRRPHQGRPEGDSASEREGHRGLLGLRAPLRRDPPPPAHGRARHVGRRVADARRDRGAAQGRADDDRRRLRAPPSPRCSTTTSTTSGSRTRSSARASSAPGPGPRTPAPPRSSSCTSRATSRARARCGATSRAAWGWSASRSPTPPRRPAPRSPPASRSARSCPARACGSRTARCIGADTVICNADPKAAARPGRRRSRASTEHGCATGRSAAPSSSSTPPSPRSPRGPPRPARTSPPARPSTSPPASTTPSAPSSAAPAASRPSASARSTSRPATTRRPPRPASTC